MELYLLRHAIAVKRRSPSLRRDRGRRLSKHGIRRMRRIARGLRALGVRADLILCSPLLRARETAEIVAAELGSAAPELTPCLEPGGEAERLCALLERRARGAKRILLVGHEPALSTLASVLLTGDERMRVTVKKGGLCKLRIENMRHGRCATLEWLLTPRALTGLC